MEKTGIIFGIIGIIGGSALLIKTEEIFLGIILIIIGIALIFFNKEESKIERRKDEK
jgi:thiamine transporter ThiT